MIDIIQVDHQQLTQVAKVFDTQAAHTEHLLRRLKARVDGLRSNWIGMGANAFYDEMERDVLPALLRLQQILHEANDTVQKIGTTFQTAEEDAAQQVRFGEGVTGAALGLAGTVSLPNSLNGGNPPAVEYEDGKRYIRVNGRLVPYTDAHANSNGHIYYVSGINNDPKSFEAGYDLISSKYANSNMSVIGLRNHSEGSVVITQVLYPLLRNREAINNDCLPKFNQKNRA